jgi:hypothetical protein
MYAKPFINKAQAESTLSKKNTLFLGGKKIIKIDLVYLPVFLFAVKCEDSRGRVYDDIVSVDGIKGEFAFYTDVEFDSSPSDAKIFADFKITESEALEIARVAYSRYLYKSNMKTRNNAVIKSINPREKFHYPYWIGYYKRKNGLDFDVVDAIGGVKQGVRMRPAFINMLIETAK